MFKHGDYAFICTLYTLFTSGQFYFLHVITVKSSLVSLNISSLKHWYLRGFLWLFSLGIHFPITRLIFFSLYILFEKEKNAYCFPASIILNKQKGVEEHDLGCYSSRVMIWYHCCMHTYLIKLQWLDVPLLLATVSKFICSIFKGPMWFNNVVSTGNAVCLNKSSCLFTVPLQVVIDYFVYWWGCLLVFF